MAKFKIYDAAGSGFFLQPEQFWTDLRLTLGTTTYFEYSPTEYGALLYQEYQFNGFFSFTEMTPLSGSVVNTPRVTVYNELGELAFEASELFTPWDLDVPAPLSPEQIAAMQATQDASAAFGLPTTIVPDYRSNQDLLEDALSGPDLIIGNNFADVINAGAGDDTILGQRGSDLIQGGPGIDTAVYSGNQSSYTLTLSPTSTTVTDRRPDGNGTDTLIDMEFLDFDTEIPALGGNPLNLDMFGGPTELGADKFSDLIELYIAYFNRAPDALGLNFWATNYSKGQSLEEIATLFLDQDETRALYPEGTSNAVFLENVYQNVLGRDFDQGGFDFWENHLNSGALGRDEFIFNFLDGAQGSDVGFLENKVKIGTYFAVTKGMSDGENASVVMD